LNYWVDTFWRHCRGSKDYWQPRSCSIIAAILVLTRVLSVWGKRNKNQPKIFPFMPRRNRDNSGKFLPNTPTASHSQPSLFFGGCDQEEPLGEQPDIFEEPIGEEEEENIPLEPMAENRNARGKWRENRGYLSHSGDQWGHQNEEYKPFSPTSLPWSDYRRS
jgi:hypothetical protein